MIGLFNIENIGKLNSGKLTKPGISSLSNRTILLSTVLCLMFMNLAVAASSSELEIDNKIYNYFEQHGVSTLKYRGEKGLNLPEELKEPLNTLTENLVTMYQNNDREFPRQSYYRFLEKLLYRFESRNFQARDRQELGGEFNRLLIAGGAGSKEVILLVNDIGIAMTTAGISIAETNNFNRYVKRMFREEVIKLSGDDPFQDGPKRDPVIETLEKTATDSETPEDLIKHYYGD